GEHVVLREHVLRQRVARLDHRGDDEVDADLLGFEQVAYRLATTDLHGELQARAPRYLDQSQQLVDARTFGFELGFHADVAEFVAAPAQDLDHLTFGLVHSRVPPDSRVRCRSGPRDYSSLPLLASGKYRKTSRAT